jgi:hydrogenase expression/formation protein HypE
MKPGKVSNAILKRSVLKQIKKRENYADKPAIGVDCGYIRLGRGKEPEIVCATSCAAEFPVFRAANNIFAAGALPAAAQCCVILPIKSEEEMLRHISEKLEKQCAMLDIQISGGHTQVSSSVNEPVVTVTVTGIKRDGHKDNPFCSAKNIRAGQDIIMTKCIGIGGIRQIIGKNRAEILKFYREDVVEKAQGETADMLVGKEAGIAADCGVSAMHDVAEGGIFGALWDMAEAAKVGLDIDFRKIPVRQEIIEICEIFDVNPYELDSTGSLLVTADNGSDIIKRLRESGICAEIIGRTTEGNNRVIRSRDEIRYLDTPKQDEVYRFI